MFILVCVAMVLDIGFHHAFADKPRGFAKQIAVLALFYELYKRHAGWVIVVYHWTS